jgi:hypothetical protein
MCAVAAPNPDAPPVMMKTLFLISMISPKELVKMNLDERMIPAHRKRQPKLPFSQDKNSLSQSDL